MTLVAPLTPSLKSRRRRWLTWAVAAVVALAAVGVFGLVTRWSGGSGGGSPVAAGKFYAVAPIDLDVKVAKDGELAAVNNIDVLNLVEGLSTIVQIVKEGAFAKKGDVLVELDSSAIRQKIEDATLEEQRADADLVVARELRAIQESENAANLEAAEVGVELAGLGLKQYLEGTYVQELADAETAVKMAETTLKTKEEDLEQTKMLYGKGFVTGADVKADELEVIEAKNARASGKMKLKVLKEYAYPSALAAKKSALVQAEQALARMQKRNASNLSKVIADEKAAEQTLVTKRRKLAHLNEQLALCVIKAPTDGLVVYAGDRSYSQTQITEGAVVRERQLLLRLPDTSNMKAVVRINESQVPKLRVGQRASVKIVGVPEPVTATLSRISPLADGGSRWWNPDLKEYPVELTLEATPRDVKPGIGAQAEIYTNRLDGVLAVPLAAIYSDRSSTFVFVQDPAAGGGLKPVPVTIAETNETHARVATGLAPGANVLILEAGQGRALLEQAGISTAEPDGRGRGRDKAKPPAEPTEVAATTTRAPAKVVPAANADAVTAPGKTSRARAAGPERAVDKAPTRAKPTPAPATPGKGTQAVTRINPGE